jgi:hypothetical protein
MPNASDEAASAGAQDIVALDIAPPLAQRGEAATGLDAARK